MSDSSYLVKTLGEYQASLERFENFNDPFILPDLRLVIRIDGRRVGSFWERIDDSDYPYSEQVVSALLGTAAEVMRNGFEADYALVHGDEISFLLAAHENANQRRRSRLLSLLASTATLFCSAEYGVPLLFHARLSELPTPTHVLDYFFWQRKVAGRNFFTKVISDCMERKGSSAQEIDKRISGLTIEERAAVAAELGMPISNFSPWQLRGAAVWWETETGTSRKLNTERNLPEKDEDYVQLLLKRLNLTRISSTAPSGVTKSAPQKSVMKKPLTPPTSIVPRFRLSPRGPVKPR